MEVQGRSPGQGSIWDGTSLYDGLDILSLCIIDNLDYNGCRSIFFLEERGLFRLCLNCLAFISYRSKLQCQ